MPRRRFRIASLGTATVALAVAGGLVAAPAIAAPQRSAQILTGWANPGVARAGSQFVMLRTVGVNEKGAAATAPHVNGHWTKFTGKTLLVRKSVPSWVSTTNKLWAPSLIKGTGKNGKWVVFYSAAVRGHNGARCIGTGTSPHATGPFTADKRPIACWHGYGHNPQDQITTKQPVGLIDATPAVVNGTTVLTFKTEHAYSHDSHGRTLWHTTIRLLRLNPRTPNKIMGNPRHKSGASVQLTDSKSWRIEENPCLVYRSKGHGKGTYTLFTSWGLFGGPDYVTQYRQNGRLWQGWKMSPTHAHRLVFDKSIHTYGHGNAQVIAGPKGTWNIFWNGHPTAKKFTHKGPDLLYVGLVTWSSNGTPRVSKIYRPR